MVHWLELGLPEDPGFVYTNIFDALAKIRIGDMQLAIDRLFDRRVRILPVDRFLGIVCHTIAITDFKVFDNRPRFPIVKG